MLVIRAGIHIMHVRIANKIDLDQTASSEAVSSSLTRVWAFCLDLFHS